MSDSSFQSKFEIEYELKQLLGQNNAQGKVFRVSKRKQRNSNVPQDFVIKCICLPNTKSGDETYEEKCAYNEIRALECMDHKNVIKCYESWTEVPPSGWKYQSEYLKSTEKIVFILMEYCNGGDLNAWLSSPRTDEEVDILVPQILDAMTYIHGQKILHRDLKPANVFIAENNVVKIGDFGLSREWGEEMTSRPGTQLYRAPEILLRGKHQYGYEVDVYSFGLIYFEIVYRDVRRNTDVIAWYEIMKYKRGDAEKPRQFTNLHPKQDLLMDWMLERNPKCRINLEEIKAWVTGRYFYYDAETKQQYGELSEKTQYIRIVNGEEMLDVDDSQSQQQIKFGTDFDLGIHSLVFDGLRSFTFELFNTNNNNYDPKENMVLVSIQSNIEKFLSLFLPNFSWDSRMNILIVEWNSAVKLFELNYDRRTYFGFIMNPVSSLDKISGDAVETMTLYSAQSLCNNDLLKFKNLSTLNLNRIGTNVDFKTLFASAENFPALTTLYLQFLDLTKLNLVDFKFKNLEYLFFGMVELDCNGTEGNLHVKRLVLQDCKVNDDITIVAEKYGLFCEDSDKCFYTYELIDKLVKFGAEQIFYDKAFKKPQNFFQKFIWRSAAYKTQLEFHFEKAALNITQSVNVELICSKQSYSIQTIQPLSLEDRNSRRIELNGDKLILANDNVLNPNYKRD